MVRSNEVDSLVFWVKMRSSMLAKKDLYHSFLQFFLASFHFFFAYEDDFLYLWLSDVCDLPFLSRFGWFIKFSSARQLKKNFALYFFNLRA